jgi:uncharacterized membrane protein
MVEDESPAPGPEPSQRAVGVSEPERDLLDRTFFVSLILKGLDGVLEVVGGVLLLLVTPSTIDRVVGTVTQHELTQDPHDFLATHLIHYANGLQGSTVVLGALYLLSHGVVKIVLVVALLKGLLWAYPWMIAFLAAFIVYQLYRLTFAPSVGLVALTIFDVFVARLTYLEYRRHRQRLMGPT